MRHIGRKNLLSLPMFLMSFLLNNSNNLDIANEHLYKRVRFLLKDTIELILKNFL